METLIEKVKKTVKKTEGKSLTERILQRIEKLRLKIKNEKIYI